MTPPELAARLGDGTPIVLRPVGPGDARLLADGFLRLPPHSIRARFLAPVARLGSEQLRQLVDVDHADPLAWGALHAEIPDFGLGIARCARLPGETNVAEVAVTVVDEFQGRGLGMLLFTLLAATARGGGIERFRAYVLPDNARVRAAAERHGARPTLEAPGLLRYEVALERLPPPREVRALAEAGLSAPSASGPALDSENPWPPPRTNAPNRRTAGPRRSPSRSGSRSSTGAGQRPCREAARRPSASSTPGAS